MKLAAPELSELDESWSDEPERIADSRPPLPGLPPAPVMQMPLPRPALPTLPAIFPESTQTLPAPPVRRQPSDRNDPTWIVRPRRDAVVPARRRPWWIADIASALVAIGMLAVAWSPAASPAPQPTVRAPAASSPARPPATPAHPASAHPTKNSATPIKRGATKKPVAKATPPIKPAATSAKKPAAKTPAGPAKKPVAQRTSAVKSIRNAPAGRTPRQ